MKKFLAGTTAIIAASVVATQAQAADPIKLELGGFMNQWVSITDQDEEQPANYAEIIQWSDTEVYFKGSTTLDNGLKVAVTIQDEQDRGNSGQDDVFMTISSATLGKLNIGATKFGSYGMSNKAPGVGLGLNDGDVDALFRDTNGLNDEVATVVTADFAGIHNDGQKVSYISPSIAGFQATFAYGLAFAGNTDPEAANTQADTVDYLLDYGLAYSGEFSGVSVGADISTVTVYYGGDGSGTATAATFGNAAVNQEQEDMTFIRGGLNIGVAGFTFGGSYLTIDDYAGTLDRDYEAFDIGVSYETGPYALSLGYISAELEESGAAGAQSDETEQYELAATYDLGAGITAIGSVAVVEKSDGSNVKANEMDGFGVSFGIAASF